MKNNFSSIKLTLLKTVLFLFLLLGLQTTHAQTWTVKTSGTTQNLNAVTFASATHGWAVGNAGTILATTDGGNTWTAQTSGTTNNLVAVSFISNLKGWAVASSGSELIRTTSDGGATWTAQSPSITTYSDICFVSETVGFMCSSVGSGAISESFKKTSDGGTTWNNQIYSRRGEGAAKSSIQFLSETTGWVAGTAAGGLTGTIYRTTTGGNGFSQWSKTSFSKPVNDLFFISATKGWIILSDGSIKTSNDGGATWTDQTSGLSTGSDICFISATKGWATGDGKIITTNDGGSTWTVQTTGTVNGIHFISENLGAAVGNSGLIRLYNGVPTATITSTAPSITSLSSIPVTVTFNTAVTGFEAEDVVVTNGTVSNFSGSGTTYTFNLIPATEGTITVNIAAGVAQDAASNLNIAATQFSIISDVTSPTVAITSTESGTSTLTSIPVTVTFSESVTGFVAGDIVLTNGTISGFSGSGASYTFNLIPTANGAITVNIAAGVAQDAATNSNTAATQFSIISSLCATPTAYNVTGTGSYCSGGEGISVELDNSEIGVTYQLKNGETNVGSPVTGDGDDISFGLQSAGTYTVIAVTIEGNCTATMTGNAVVTMNEKPAAPTTTEGLINNEIVLCNADYLSEAAAFIVGQNIKWYDFEHNLIADPSTASAYSNTYYVTQTNENGCESDETQVYVTNNVPEVPDTETEQAFCSGATVADLQYTIGKRKDKNANTGNTNRGDDVYWYAAAEGGEPLSNETVLTSGTYYLGASIGDCHSETRTAVTVEIVPLEVTTQNVTVYGSYTWTADGTTYYASGTYEHQVACKKNILVLTISATPLTKIKASQCNIGAIATLNTKIYANEVSGADAYVFEVTNGTNVRTFGPTTERYFNLTQLTGGALYDTTYSIRVAVNIGSNLGAYGDACTLSTPVVPAVTNIETAQCTTGTLAALNTKIQATSVIGVNEYKFEITNGTTVRTYETANRYFNLTQVLGGATYNTAYTIRVAVKYNDGLYTEYGDACTLTTPFPPLTKLQASQCNGSVALLTTKIYANAVNSVQGYRFEITDGTTVRPFLDTTLNYFNLTEVSGGATYNKTYKVRVAVKYNDDYSSFGDFCNITTPAVPPLTKIKPAQCDMGAIAALNTKIYANEVAGVDAYVFEVTNGTNVRTFEAIGLRYFNLTQLTGGALYNTTYSIRVAVRIGTSLGAYGDACTLSTPAVPPMTKIQATQCENPILASLSTVIRADAVTGVSGYQFEVTNGENVRYAYSDTRAFQLTQLEGGVAYNTTYGIRVATKVGNGVYGSFGDQCSVTTPNNPNAKGGNTDEFSKQAAPFQEEEIAKTIILKAYPNPFTNVFKLDYTPLTLGKITATVYDMTGKVIETRTFEATQTNNQEFGNSYATGIYIMNIGQGSNVQNIRIIKQ